MHTGAKMPVEHQSILHCLKALQQQDKTNSLSTAVTEERAQRSFEGQAIYLAFLFTRKHEKCLPFLRCFSLTLGVALSHHTLLIWAISAQPSVPHIRKAVHQLLICRCEPPGVCAGQPDCPANLVRVGQHSCCKSSATTHFKLKAIRCPSPYSAPSPMLIGVASLHSVGLFFPRGLLGGWFFFFPFLSLLPMEFFLIVLLRTRLCPIIWSMVFSLYSKLTPSLRRSWDFSQEISEQYLSTFQHQLRLAVWFHPQMNHPQESTPWVGHGWVSLLAPTPSALNTAVF